MPSNLGEDRLIVHSFTRMMNYLLAEGKSETRLLDSFGEVLVINAQVTNGQGVLRDKAFHRTRAILNGEFGSVRLVCRGLARIILGMQETSNGSALGAWDPQVA